MKLIKDIVAYKESYAGRKLIETERSYYISEIFSATEYSELLKLKNAGSFEIKSVFMENESTDPQEEFFTKLGLMEIRNVLEKILQGTQDRTRECYRSLFTAYCINKSMLIEDLIPLLDNEILEAYRNDGEKPKQREIYLKYHPEVQKESAGVRASDMTKDFLRKIHTALING